MPMISLYIFTYKGHRFFKILWPFLFYKRKSCQTTIPWHVFKGSRNIKKRFS